MSESPLLIPILSVVLGFIIAYFILNNKLKNESNNRKKLAGKYAEKFIPLMKGFKWKPEDTYFLGMPIDFIVFDGLNDGYVKNVVLIEAKTGQSSLTKRERSIKDAVKRNNVHWQMIKV